MKLRWVVVGAVVAVAGSILVAKHLKEFKILNTDSFENDAKSSSNQYESDMIEPEFEEVDFFA